MNTGYYISLIINMVLALLLPLTVGIVVSKKLTRLRVVLIGAAVFTVFQMIIRIPLIQIFQLSFPQLVPTQTISAHYIVYSAILAVTAGLFEEFGRYIGLVTVLKKFRNWGDGFGFGIGHGGIEAILLVGIPNINGFFTVLADPSQPVWYIAMGGIERLFAMTIQIALSLLVMLAVRKKKISLVLLAVALHMVVDFPVGILAMAGGIMLTEGYVAVCAIVSLVWIVKSRKLFGTVKEEIGGIGMLQS